jgi:hypothetical protein
MAKTQLSLYIRLIFPHPLQENVYDHIHELLLKVFLSGKFLAG